MKKSISIVLLVALFLLSVMPVWADQVTLKNGDRLSGKIIKQDDEKIVLKTDFAGIITIAKTNVEKVVFEKTTVEETVAKEFAVKEEKETTKVEEAKTESGEGFAANSEIEKEAATATVPAAKNRALSLTEGWDGSANVGFSFTSGNSRTTTFTAGVRAEKSSESDKWTTYLNTLWNSNRAGGINVTTSNAIWGGLRYDRNITRKLFAFGSYDFERDKPQLLNFRSVVGGGLGYHVIKNDKTELDLFGGAAWNKTWFVGGLSRSSAEILAGNTLKHKFNERMKFQQGFTFYPNLTNAGEYRFIFDSTLSADVTSRIGWFVTVADRYNSLPLAGIEKNDFLFATGLKVGFGKKK